MVDPDEFSKKLNKKYEEWVEGFLLEGSRGRNALNTLETMPTSRTQEELHQLKSNVTRICFEAVYCGSPSFKDSGKISREEVSDILKGVPGQLKALGTLKRFIEKYPDHSGWAFFSGFLEASGNTPLAKILEGWDGDIVNDFLKEGFSIYEKGLTFLEEGLCEVREETLLAWRASGTLIYPNPLNKREQGANAAENDLFFNLAFLFQNYTNSHLEGSGLSKIEGPLPEEGNPCYKHISELANAVFYKDDNPANEEKEFTPLKVGDRLRKLKQKGVTVAPFNRPPPEDVGY